MHQPIEISLDVRFGAGRVGRLDTANDAVEVVGCDHGGRALRSRCQNSRAENVATDCGQKRGQHEIRRNTPQAATDDVFRVRAVDQNSDLRVGVISGPESGVTRPQVEGWA